MISLINLKKHREQKIFHCLKFLKKIKSCYCFGSLHSNHCYGKKAEMETIMFNAIFVGNVFNNHVQKMQCVAVRTNIYD